MTGSPVFFDNQGTRTVDNVDRTASLQQSGLTTTVDTTSFGLTVTEDMTGLSDTDSVAVSYQNAAVTSADAGGPLIFDASNLTRTADGSVVDGDLGVNALIPGFEPHTFGWTRGGTTLGTGEDLVVEILSSGLTTTVDTALLELEVTDLAGANDTAGTNVSYTNALPTIGNASATAQGSHLLFELAYGDLDLSVNSVIGGQAGGRVDQRHDRRNTNRQ